MRNKLEDLNNHLFEAIERLNDDEICKDAESTLAEINKDKAIAEMADQIIKIKELQLSALRTANDLGAVVNNPLKLIGLDE